MKHQEYLRQLAAGQELILPSGLEVRVKPVDSSVLFSGNYPSELMAIIRGHMAGKSKAEQDAFEALPEEQKAIENINSTRKFGEVVAENAVIEPHLVYTDPVGDDQMAMKDMATNDLAFLMGLINMPLARVHSFCRRQNEIMELVLAGKDDEADALQRHWDDRTSAGDHAANAAPALPLDGTTDDRQPVADALPV